MATQEELDILAKYSSPGLKRNESSRYGMMWRLLEGFRQTREEREAQLDEMFPPQPIGATTGG